ncbi:MAG: inositol monophosphatase family protein [Cyclobacteriaceae bacterium]
MNNLTSRNLKELCETAITAATAAGQFIQSQFDKHYTTQSKIGGDSLASQVVTEVDLKAQEIILSHLEKSIDTFDLGLLTEEAEDDQSRSTKNFFWCIDPMDGTLPFTERRTGYSVSIALISRAGDPVIGVVYIPDLKQCYSAIKGEGVLLNDQAFVRNAIQNEHILHIYMDQSFTVEPYFSFVKNQFNDLLDGDLSKIQFHDNYGGVRNAIGVMNSGKGCYFKFPKERKGCGSIWDYAATRLFFEELDLFVTNAAGEKLHLNNPTSTFMNHAGVLYTTHEELSEFIVAIGKKVRSKETGSSY